MSTVNGKWYDDNDPPKAIHALAVHHIDRATALFKEIDGRMGVHDPFNDSFITAMATTATAHSTQALALFASLDYHAKVN